MSVEALEIMRQQRRDQIELNPGSETFTVSDAADFIGIFDRMHMEEDSDGGNVQQKLLNPVVMVSEIPAGITERVSVITREEGDSYTFLFAGKDEEGVPILWLF